jgi:hypothetical protein
MSWPSPVDPVAVTIGGITYEGPGNIFLRSAHRIRLRKSRLADAAAQSSRCNVLGARQSLSSVTHPGRIAGLLECVDRREPLLDGKKRALSKFR